MDPTRLDLAAYREAKEKKMSKVVKVGEDCRLLLKRFNPRTGEELKPEEHALVPEMVEQLRTQAQRLMETADLLEADMKDAGVVVKASE